MIGQNAIRKLQPASGRFGVRLLALVGVLAALAGPFLLLTDGGRELSGMPWYLWIILPLLLLLVIAAGVVMSRQVSHHAEDISISPDHRETERRR
jgi:hypothetical protein